MTIAKTKQTRAPVLYKIKNIPSALKYYRKQIIAGLILMVLVTVTFSFANCEVKWDEAGGLYKTMYSMIDNIMGNASLGEIEEKISVKLSDDTIVLAGYSITNLDFVNSVSEMAGMFAVCIAGLMLGVSLANTRSDGNTEAALIKKFAYFAVSMVLIFNAKDLCYGIANIGTGIASSVVELAKNAGDTQQNLESVKKSIFSNCYTQLDNLKWYEKIIPAIGNFTNPLGVILELLIPNIIMVVVGLIISFTCLSRALEIIILATFSPLAFCEPIEDGRIGQGAGGRFVKNVLALSLSGAIILFIVALCNTISSDIIMKTITDVTDEQKFLSIVPTIVTLGLAEGGLVMKAQSIAKTIVGAG